MSKLYFATIHSDRIRAAWPHLNEWARTTIVDIARRAEPYKGHPTSGQLQLVLKLLSEAEDRAARPARETAPAVDLTRINEMFAKAAKSLKAPKVRFLTDTLGEFTVSPAKATSANPGFLYVKSSGDGYLGKISPEGVFSPSREAPANVRTAIETFAANPAKAAQAYGQETGACCFCARRLEDPVSVELGYGPVCASRFGLPHRATGVGSFKAEAVEDLSHTEQDVHGSYGEDL